MNTTIHAWRRNGAKTGDLKYILVEPLRHTSYVRPTAGGWLCFDGKEIEVTPFANKWLSIIPADKSRGTAIFLVVALAYCCDGASCAPDLECVMDGTFVHDPVYQFAEEIAAAWGCGVAAVLRWGDALFSEVMLHRHTPKVIRVAYYVPVSLAGYPYNRALHWWHGRKPQDGTQGPPAIAGG